MYGTTSGADQRRQTLCLMAITNVRNAAGISGEKIFLCGQRQQHIPPLKMAQAIPKGTVGRVLKDPGRLTRKKGYFLKLSSIKAFLVKGTRI